MKHQAYRETLEYLEDFRARSDSVLISFSGGKDSLAVADICSRVFPHVEAFHMFLVPELACVERDLEVGRKLWNLKIRQYPHWQLSKIFAAGTFCDPYYGHARLPKVGYRDVLNMVIVDSGINMVAHGAKRADSIWRQRNMSQLKRYGDVMFPLAGWHKVDVITYLEARGIPIPKQEGNVASGVGLIPHWLLWAYDNHREDFERVAAAFPYVEAVVKRREWHGVKA